MVKEEVERQRMRGHFAVRFSTEKGDEEGPGQRVDQGGAHIDRRVPTLLLSKDLIRFEACSFGFRPKRSATQAKEMLRKSGYRGHWWVVDADNRCPYRDRFSYSIRALKTPSAGSL